MYNIFHNMQLVGELNSLTNIHSCKYNINWSAEITFNWLIGLLEELQCKISNEKLIMVASQ